MNRYLSLYFDFWRAVAAILVFVWHTEESFFSNDVLIDFLQLPDCSAHLAVIVFFVLSGFLIDRSATKPGVTLRRFLFDRFTRLYSVVIPALILTVAIGFTVGTLKPDLQHPAYTQDWMALRYLINGLFLQQIWNYCVVPGVNNPFWSLSYEFWYYMGLAAFVFLPRWWKAVGILIISFVAGLKIILLLPAWLAGVIAHRVYQKKLRMPLSLSCIGFSLSITGIIWTMFVSDYFGLWENMTIQYPLYYSSKALVDFGFATLVAANFLCISWIFSDSSSLPSSLDLPVAITRYVSNRTFSIYLYHFPLLFLFGVFWDYDKKA